MAENSKIEWVDDSINFWWGCVEVGPGCDNCYARELSKRWGFDAWGTDKPRREMPNAFTQIAKFQRKAAKEGVKRTVFINSMSDLAELLPVSHPSSRFMYEARSKFLKETVHECPDLIFIWLTKRIGNVPKIVPGEWMKGDWPANVWLIPSIVNQKEADRDIPKLETIPAPIRGLSIEPQLGEVDLSKWLPIELDRDGTWRRRSKFGEGDSFLKWIVQGFESGPKARPGHPQWARSLRDQCQASGTPYFWKQWGEWLPGHHFTPELKEYDASIEQSRFQCAQWGDEGWSIGHVLAKDTHDPDALYRVGKKKAGRLLDGREHNEFPEVLYV